MEAQEEIARLQAENETLMKRSSLLSKLTNDDSAVRFYTGFPSYLLLMNFFQVIYPTTLTMKSYQQYQRFNTGKTQSSRPSACFNSSSIPLIGQFLLTLKKMQLGTLDQELADEFNVSLSTVSRTFLTWVYYLYFVICSSELWPSKEKVKLHMPHVFVETQFRNTRVILDCSEIQVQQPSSLYLNSEFYSNYKGRTTLKGLIGITPGGAVSFVSHLFPGSLSDRAITTASGLLDMLEPGDEVMVDKGFRIQDLLDEKCAFRHMPPFLDQCRTQFDADEVLQTQSIARLRVHVERAIRRVKCFHIFDRPVPLTMAGSIDEIWAVCCLLTNFRGDLL